MHAGYLLDRSIGSFGRIVFLLFRLDFEAVFEGGKFGFGIVFGCSDVLFKVFGDVGLGDVDESSVLGFVVLLRCLFSQFGGVA